jgi:hypothetical protein
MIMQDTINFLEALYRNTTGYAEMRLIHKSGDWKQAKKIYRPSATIHTCNMDYLTEMNNEYHIYHRIGVSATQASKKADITQITALWLDVDGIDVTYYQRLEAMYLPPTVIINSGGGYHAYWLLREPVIVDSEDKRFEIERIMQGMILAYGDGADDATKDITRILRTPNFYNIKDKYNPYPLCKVVYHDNKLMDRYPYHRMKRNYHHLGAPKVLKPRRHIPQDAYSDDLPRYVRNYLEHGAMSGERNKKLYAAARGFLDAGKSQFEAEGELITRALADGLTQSEATQTINSAYRSSPNPQARLPRHMQNLMSIEDNQDEQ